MASKRSNQRTKTANGSQGSKWCSKALRLALYIRDGFVCMYCGKDLKNSHYRDLTLDHLLSRNELKALLNSGQGTEISNKILHGATNLILSCRSCNSSRQDKPWRQYATGGAIERISYQITLPINLVLARAILKGIVADPRLEEAA